MSDMTDVLMAAMECDVREDSPDCTHDGYCGGHGNISYCDQHDSDEWLDYEAGKQCKYAVSLAAALSAAGFGPVREAREAAWDEGYSACRTRPRIDGYFINRINPYRKG